MRSARLLLTALVTAAAVTGCSDPTPPEAPRPPASSRSSTATPAPQAGPPPLEQVAAATQSVAGHLMGQLSTPGGVPLSLAVGDGSVLGVAVGEGIEVAGYEVYAGRRAPAVRFCLAHDEGPWAAFDSGIGELVADLGGACVYSAADLPTSRRGEGLSPDRLAELEPRTVEELSWVLTSAATGVGTQLGAMAVMDRPADLDELRDAEDLAPAHPDVSVSGYQVHAAEKKGRRPASFVVCVSSGLGGWARFDSHDPDQVLFGVTDQCQTGPLHGFGEHR